MSTVLWQDDYLIHLINYCGEFYTLRYKPTNYTFELSSIVEDTVRQKLQDGIPIETIKTHLSHLTKDMSMMKGNHLTREK